MYAYLRQTTLAKNTMMMIVIKNKLMIVNKTRNVLTLVLAVPVLTMTTIKDKHINSNNMVLDATDFFLRFRQDSEIPIKGHLCMLHLLHFSRSK